MEPTPALSDSVNSSTIAPWPDCASPPPAAPPPEYSTSPAEVAALRRLSDNLLSLLRGPSSLLSDAVISVPSNDGGAPRELRAHRCLLAARSPLFRRLLLADGPGADPPPARFELRDLVAGFEVGFEALELVVGYLYSGMVGSLPRGVCECADEECSHVGCWPAVEFLLQVLLVAARFEIMELVYLFQRRLLDILEEVAVDDIPMILFVAKMCNEACSKLVTKCVDTVAKSDLDIVTLEKALPLDVVEQVKKSRSHLGLGGKEPDMHVRRIHKALDSDDIELVKLLLVEGNATLDAACALHYSLAHCNAKVTAELLDLERADVNHKNPRGYTVLHIAAMHKDPEIIVSLLQKGARLSDLTPDGKKAIRVSKRVTKYVDYKKPYEQGKAACKDRLCIEIFEQAERKDPLIRAAALLSIAMADNDVLRKLKYLELRVALAKLLYPMEAKVAMANAHVDETLPFTPEDLFTGNERTTMVFNEISFNITEKHLSRLRALYKTVELGMRYFPRCSEVLSKIVDDDSSDLASVDHHTSERRRKRYMELQEEMMKAFLEDTEFDGSALHSSSPSKSTGRARTKLPRK